MLGNLDTHDRICRILADKTGSVVVAVDYRLSPEAKYPSAVREVAAVASYLHGQGAAFGVDGERLAFAGDSGGAHLGLAATLHLREELGGSGFVRCCLLFYGCSLRPGRLVVHAPARRPVGRPDGGGLAVVPGLYAEDAMRSPASPTRTCSSTT